MVILQINIIIIFFPLISLIFADKIIFKRCDYLSAIYKILHENLSFSFSRVNLNIVQPILLSIKEREISGEKVWRSKVNVVNPVNISLWKVWFAAQEKVIFNFLFVIKKKAKDFGKLLDDNICYQTFLYFSVWIICYFH